MGQAMFIGGRWVQVGSVTASSSEGMNALRKKLETEYLYKAVGQPRGQPPKDPGSAVMTEIKSAVSTGRISAEEGEEMVASSLGPVPYRLLPPVSQGGGGVIRELHAKESIPYGGASPPMPTPTQQELAIQKGAVKIFEKEAKKRALEEGRAPTPLATHVSTTPDRTLLAGKPIVKEKVIGDKTFITRVDVGESIVDPKVVGEVLVSKDPTGEDVKVSKAYPEPPPGMRQPKVSEVEAEIKKIVGLPKAPETRVSVLDKKITPAIESKSKPDIIKMGVGPEIHISESNIDRILGISSGDYAATAREFGLSKKEFESMPYWKRAVLARTGRDVVGPTLPDVITSIPLIGKPLRKRLGAPSINFPTTWFRPQGGKEIAGHKQFIGEMYTQNLFTAEKQERELKASMQEWSAYGPQDFQQAVKKQEALTQISMDLKATQDYKRDLKSWQEVELAGVSDYSRSVEGYEKDRIKNLGLKIGGLTGLGLVSISLTPGLTSLGMAKTVGYTYGGYSSFLATYQTAGLMKDKAAKEMESLLTTTEKYNIPVIYPKEYVLASQLTGKSKKEIAVMGTNIFGEGVALVSGLGAGVVTQRALYGIEKGISKVEPAKLDLKTKEYGVKSQDLPRGFKTDLGKSLKSAGKNIPMKGKVRLTYDVDTATNIIKSKSAAEFSAIQSHPYYKPVKYDISVVGGETAKLTSTPTMKHIVKGKEGYFVHKPEVPTFEVSKGGYRMFVKTPTGKVFSSIIDVPGGYSTPVNPEKILSGLKVSYTAPTGTGRGAQLGSKIISKKGVSIPKTLSLGQVSEKQLNMWDSFRRLQVTTPKGKTTDLGVRYESYQDYTKGGIKGVKETIKGVEYSLSLDKPLKSAVSSKLKVYAEFIGKPTAYLKKPMGVGSVEQKPGEGVLSYLKSAYTKQIQKTGLATSLSEKPLTGILAATLPSQKLATTPISLSLPPVKTMSLRSEAPPKAVVSQAPKMEMQSLFKQYPILKQPIKQAPKMESIFRPRVISKESVFQVPKSSTFLRSVPQQVPKQAPMQLPKQVPLSKQIPFQQPRQMPQQMPKHGPMQLPKQIPRQSPLSIPDTRQMPIPNILDTPRVIMQTPRPPPPNFGKVIPPTKLITPHLTGFPLPLGGGGGKKRYTSLFKKWVKRNPWKSPKKFAQDLIGGKRKKKKLRWSI